MNIQKINPFKNTADQKRDNDGKFTAGSGGLTKLKKFNWARSAPIIVLISLVGGFLVFKSFAGAAPTPVYQYSAYNKKVTVCAHFNRDDVEANKKSGSCANTSAESLAYRLYEGILGRAPEIAKQPAADINKAQDPSKSGYGYWTNKLAGDRLHTTRAAQLIMDSKEQKGSAAAADKKYVEDLYVVILGRPGSATDVNWWSSRITAKTKTRDEAIRYFASKASPVITAAAAQAKMNDTSNTAFVKRMYAGFLGRSDSKIDPKGLAYWKGKLDSKKYTRYQVAAVFAQSKESAAFYGADFAKFIKAAPKIAVTTKAADAQKYREAQAHVYAADTNNKWKAAVNFVKESNKDVKTAKDTAAKSKISQQDYSKTIADAQHASEAKYNKIMALYNAAKKSYDKADAVLKTSREVSAYSPDLSSSATEVWRNKAAVYTVDTKNRGTVVKQNITSIANYYKTAVTKYNKQCNSGTDYNGSSDGCGTPPPPVNTGGGVGGSEPAGSCSGVKPGSVSSAIKGCQRTLGLTGAAVDGNWGCGTEAAFRAKYPNSNHRLTCTSLGDGSGVHNCPTDQSYIDSRCQPAWRPPSSPTCYQGTYPTLRHSSVSKSGYNIEAYSCMSGDNRLSGSFRSFGCATNFSKKEVYSHYYACYHP